MKTRLSVAYIGNVGIAQNLRYLEDAAEKLPNVIFYIVGDGTDYKSLVKYAEGKHVPNLTMTGRLGWDEIKEIYFRAHVLYAQLMPDFDMAMLANGGLDLPLDEPSLFAGRHHGVLQDARDYLAWEEDLPSEIDESIHDSWCQELATSPKLDA